MSPTGSLPGSGGMRQWPGVTRLRKILSGSFTQRSVAVYEHFVSGLTDEVLNAGLPGDGEPFDPRVTINGPPAGP